MSSTDIRYIVLSDLHLGQDRSVLTAVIDNDVPTAERTEPALEALMNCLEHLVRQNQPGARKPTLILLGDIIEQAFTNIDVAGPIFQRFVELWRGADQEPIFDEVVFIAGNHDHNMWEFTRAYQYWKFLAEGTKAPQPPAQTPGVRHATGLRERDLIEGDQDLIGLLINRQLAPAADPLRTVLPVKIYYPTLALLSPSRKRAVLFNHGHYFEPIYQLMSTLLTYLSVTPPQAPTAEGVERSNFAWLDFVWSMLGRQGDVGLEIERIYDSVSNTAELEAVLSRGLSRLIKQSGFDPEETFWRVVSVSIAKLVVKIARPDLETLSSTEELLSPRTIKTMREYVEGPLRKQIESDDELRGVKDMTLVFGHTHKPFQHEQDEVYPINMYNTGGWVIDPLPNDDQPGRGGSCVLLNEDLEITSVQFYRQTVNSAGVKTGSLNTGTDFHKHVCEVINADRDKSFKDFSTKVAASVDCRIHQKPGL